MHSKGSLSPTCALSQLGALGGCPSDGLGPLPASSWTFFSAAEEVGNDPATAAALATYEPGVWLSNAPSMEAH